MLGLAWLPVFLITLVHYNTGMDHHWIHDILRRLYYTCHSSQDTFINMIKAAPRYQPEEKFQSWLFRIAGNQARSRLRRRKILRWLPLSEEYESAAAPGPDALAARTNDSSRMRLPACPIVSVKPWC